MIDIEMLHPRYPESSDLEVSLGDNHRDWAPRWVYRLFSGWYWWAGTRQKGNTKMVSTTYIPWKQLHRPLNVYQSYAWVCCPCSGDGRLFKNSLHWLQSYGIHELKPHWPPEPHKVVGKIGAPDRGMSSFLGDTNFYSPLGPGTQTSLSPRAKWSTSIPLAAVTKIRASNMCKSYFPGYTGAWQKGSTDGVDEFPPPVF